jgi:tRNA-Thr(GGU) m(6)t(6)A37 methyltransferase TsaA
MKRNADIGVFTEPSNLASAPGFDTVPSNDSQTTSKGSILTMPVSFRPIGTAHTEADSIPRHWTVSQVEGTLVIDPQYTKGLADIAAGQRIVVLFHFHHCPPFSPELLTQTPPHRHRSMGVFSICSPRRPNAIGLSVLEVLAIDGNVLKVRCMDMIDGTPILDIKPFIACDGDLPSRDDPALAP